MNTDHIVNGPVLEYRAASRAYIPASLCGGARRSGTNDKIGSVLNLLRWVSPRTIKETSVPLSEYGYPSMIGAR